MARVSERVSQRRAKWIFICGGEYKALQKSWAESLRLSDAYSVDVVFVLPESNYSPRITLEKYNYKPIPLGYTIFMDLIDHRAIGIGRTNNIENTFDNVIEEIEKDIKIPVFWSNYSFEDTWCLWLLQPQGGELFSDTESKIKDFFNQRASSYSFSKELDIAQKYRRKHPKKTNLKPSEHCGYTNGGEHVVEMYKLLSPMKTG